MKYMSQLPKNKQLKLVKTLNTQMFTDIILTNSLADEFEVDRNELLEFYIARLRNYLDKNDMNDKEKLKIDLKGLVKFIKRGG